MTELGPLSRLPARQLDLPEPGRNSDPDFFLFESRLYEFYAYFSAENRCRPGRCAHGTGWGAVLRLSNLQTIRIMKKLMMTGALVLLALLLVGRTEAREPGTFQLSTHMLDISQGAPAPDVAVALCAQEPDGSWRVVAERRTDANGRIADLLPHGAPGANDGLYRLHFETDPYFAAQGLRSIYPYVEVTFRIEGGRSLPHSYHHVGERLFDLSRQLIRSAGAGPSAAFCRPARWRGARSGYGDLRLPFFLPFWRDVSAVE